MNDHDDAEPAGSSGATVNLNKPLCGLLSKYTNVMKGWQNRYFVLDPNGCTLEYFEREELKHQRPRGYLHLQGAAIAPSDEDALTFTIHSANGEIYRLRADSTKTRQLWVSRLMYIAQSIRSRTSTESGELRTSRASPSTLSQSHTAGPGSKHKSQSTTSLDENPALVEVKEYVHEVFNLEEQLTEKIDALPSHGGHINSLDPDTLILKACSKATLSCLESCLEVLDRQNAAAARDAFSKNHLPSGARVEWLSTVKTRRDSAQSGGVADTLSGPTSLSERTKILVEEGLLGFSQPYPVPHIDHDDEVEDIDSFNEKDLGEIEAHKSVILHLLSQLKLGMDLTRVVLPTFILEKRSLLEMFADCMAHPDTFLKIADCSTPESRMHQVVEWYLTSFHEGRKGSVAKKPYNPIIGETFHCSWDVNDSETSSSNRLIYTAEQVSHHPPVSAFHVSSQEKRISMTGSLWTKSKFMGMSIGVTMIGQLTLALPQYGEEYVMTLPSAYARSILTYPWVELGDKCRISCKKTGYQASIVFHTKPFYGGKLHRISGDVKNPEGTVLSKISGAWNGEIEITSYKGAPSTAVIDTQKLEIFKKRVRPIDKQGDHESRRLWRHVTNALKMNDLATATDHKTLLESRQREDEKHRKEKSISFPTKYFQRTGDLSCWVYKGPHART